MGNRILVLIISGLISLMAAPVLASDTEEVSTEKAIPTVTVATAENARMQAQVPVTGSLVARQEVQVYPLVSGYEIVEVLAETGDSVEKDQVLARLSTATLEAQLAQAAAEHLRAEAGLKQAGTTLERAQRLRNSNSGSQATLDDAIAAEVNARAGVAQAEAALRIARLDLERAEITAPVAGLITAKNATLGALSGSAAEPLFTMIAEGKIELSAQVIETALQQVSVGDPVKVNVAGLGEVDGKVRLIPASVDPVTRLGIMRISLDDVAGLRTGLFASANIITAKREAVTVPATAVLANDEGEHVQVVKDGVIEARPVQTGLLWDGRREIIEGITAGETVIARAGAFFRDGDNVRVIKPDADVENTEATAPEAAGDASAPEAEAH